MSLHEEILFERLLPKYERRFGEEPPVAGLPVEEAVRIMREKVKFQTTDDRDVGSGHE